MIPLVDDTPSAPRDGSPSATEFSVLRRGTQCLFARNSRIWGPPAWRLDLTFAQNIEQSKAAVDDFLISGQREEVDGFVYSLPDRSFGATLGALCRTTSKLVYNLYELYSQRPASAAEIESATWSFTINGQRLFLLMTGPCYDASHSRYSFGSESTFALLQPQHAFVRRHMPGSHVISEEIRTTIRRLYDANFRPYDIAITLGPLEAYRFVKPLRLGDAPVRWWAQSA